MVNLVYFQHLLLKGPAEELAVYKSLIGTIEGNSSEKIDVLEMQFILCHLHKKRLMTLI